MVTAWYYCSEQKIQPKDTSNKNKVVLSSFLDTGNGGGNQTLVKHDWSEKKIHQTKTRLSCPPSLIKEME